MPTPKRPKRPSPKERKQLEELLRRPVAQPPSSLQVRFDKGPRPATALKALEVTDPQARKLAEHLHKRREEIVERLAQDRDLAEQFVNDPPAALKALDVPQDLLPEGKWALIEALQGRVREVQLGFGDAKHVPGHLHDIELDAEHQALNLLAAAMDIVNANPSRKTEFTTNPWAIVTEAAQTALPSGATPAARASVVNDVVAALDAAAGRTTSSSPATVALDAAWNTVIPFQPRA